MLNYQFRVRWCFLIWMLPAILLSACGKSTATKGLAMTPDDYAAIECKPLDRSIYPLLDEEAEKDFQQAFEMEAPKGIPIDFKEVARLYQRAADKGHWKAMNNLSILYLRGLGVEQSDQKSTELIQQMAALNIPEGYMTLGIAIDEGRGGLKGGREKALEQYAKAAEQGHPRAQTIIGKYLLNHTPHKQAGKDMLYCAFQQGYGEAVYRLAAQYKLIDKDLAKAVQYYREGAKLGHASAINQLRRAYRVGDLGLYQDIDRARCLLHLKKRLDKDPSLTFPNLDELCPGTVEQPY